MGIICTIALAITLVASLLVNSFFDKEDTFYVRNAELENRDYLNTFSPARPKSLEEEQFIVYAHRVREGAGSIFAYRRYSNGSMAIDDETYLKVTVWLATGPPAKPLDIPLGESSALAIFTKGGSAWPRNGCAGYLSHGTVRIEPHRGSYWIEIDGEAEPIALLNEGGCKTRRIVLSFKAKELAYQEITPWLGKHGQHPYDETYRYE